LDRYSREREVTPAFLERVAEWIERSGEVLVILRYLRAAGGKDFCLCRTAEEFRAISGQAPAGTDIEVFRDPQLPVRGIVTEEFVRAALAVVPDGAEYLLLTREQRAGTLFSRWADLGASHAELLEVLQEHDGVEVMVGICPDFSAPDHDGLVSASKGGIEGPR